MEVGLEMGVFVGGLSLETFMGSVGLTTVSPAVVGLTVSPMRAVQCDAQAMTGGVTVTVSEAGGGQVEALA